MSIDKVLPFFSKYSKSNYTMAGEKNNKRRIAIGVVGALLVAGIITLIAVLTTRPKNLDLTTSAAVESLPSLIKAVTIGGGAIAVEYTELLEDKSIMFYYVALSDLDASEIQAELNLENPALYLFRDVGTMESSLRVGLVNEISFPYRLPDSFLPGDYNGLFLTEDNSSEDPWGNENTFMSSFAIIDPSQNIAMEENDMEDAVMKGTPMEDTAMEGTPMEDTPVLTTDAPVVPPTVLVGSLEGDDYDIEGTITIDTVMDLKGGEIADVARLRFNVAAVRAPGPYLYLSKRPFSETEEGNLVEEDIEIEIKGVDNGSFTMDGMFEQILDEIGDAKDLKEYEGGSFIIWCRPFGVWLGGGPIEASN